MRGRRRSGQFHIYEVGRHLKYKAPQWTRNASCLTRKVEGATNCKSQSDLRIGAELRLSNSGAGKRIENTGGNLGMHSGYLKRNIYVEYRE